MRSIATESLAIACSLGLVVVVPSALAEAPNSATDAQKPLAYDSSVPPPTLSGVRYGEHSRHVLDFWQADSDMPTPLVLVIHGERCEQVGVECEIVYPDAADVRYTNPTDYLIATLRATPDKD